MKNIINYFVV